MTREIGFAEYVALGDSMSIDLYPALDLGHTDVAVALERAEHAGAIAPVGAASLLYRNHEESWPEETGQDLTSRYPGIAFHPLAQDGATIGDVFGEQLPRLAPSEEETLVTLTVGANDLLSAFGNRPRRSLLERIVRDVVAAYAELVAAVRVVRPQSALLVTTIYDPSDRQGRMPGVLDDAGLLPLQHLDALNDGIRSLARDTPRAALAEAYGRFLGHGVTAAPEDRWYWTRSIVEPNARGAHELRLLWLETLDVALADGTLDD